MTEPANDTTKDAPKDALKVAPTNTPDDANGEWHDIAARDQLDADFPLSVEVNSQKLGVYLMGDEVHVLGDVCPHAYALLSQGFQENGVIECPLHAAQFDIATGKCLTEIGGSDIQCFPVRVKDGRVAIMMVKA